MFNDGFIGTAGEDIEFEVGARSQGELGEREPEECEAVRSIKTPLRPNAQEVMEHEDTHLPYRDWCEHCVRGRALGQGHARSTPASKIPVVALDYFFMTKDNLMTPSECRAALQGGMEEAVEKGEIIKCLMIKCSYTKAELALVVGKKGLDKYTTDRVVAFVQWLGHSRLIMKSDNEPSLVALVRDALKAIRVELQPDTATEEHSPAYDSQCNGMIEGAIRNTRGLFRTLRSYLQHKIGRTIEIDHPLLTWMLEHTSTLRNAIIRGSDGYTPWQRSRGRAFAMSSFSFGEKCHFKLPMKGPHKEKRGNSTDLWEDGIFFGYSYMSNEYVYANARGVSTARSVTRRPVQERWSVDDMSALRATPASRHEPRGQGQGLEAPNREEAAPANVSRAQIRAFRVMKRYLEDPNIGYSDNCDQCDHIRRYGVGRSGATHSETCRERVMTKLAETDEGRAIVEATEERISRALGEQIEAGPSPSDIGAPSVQMPPLDSHPGFEPRAEIDNTPPQEMDQRESPPDQMDIDLPDEPMSPMDADMVDGPGMDLGQVRCLGSDAVSPLMSQARRNSGESEAFETSINLLDTATELMVNQMDGCNKAYARERRSAFNRIVSEIYSPPRVSALAKALPGYGLQPGFALDLTTQDTDGKLWDFNSVEMRRRARRLVQETKPLFLVASPMCKAFSTWQALNHKKYGHDPDQVRREKARAVMHINFVSELIEMQIAGDRFFFYEQPAWATSWMCESVQRLMAYPEVNRVLADQCQHGLAVQRGERKGDPVRKPTGFMSNSRALLNKLDKRCGGRNGRCSEGGMHAPCSGSIARDSQVYGKKLCMAILEACRLR